MCFRIGRYEVSQADDCVEIRFPQLDDSEKIDKRFVFTMFLIWGLITLGLTLFTLLIHEYAISVLFFIVIGLGGLYICINVLKRAETRFFSVVLDKDGICEKWEYPDQIIEKALKWEELSDCLLFPYVVGRGRPPQWYDVIVFSKVKQDEQTLRKTIRKTWKSSMQYELKFRNISDSIFIVIDSENGEQLYQLLKEFILKHSLTKL